MIEFNVGVEGEDAPAVNDVCRFCSKVLRVNGILGNSALIFSKTRQQHKSLADRLADLGLALRPSENRSIRMCKTCIHVVDHLERYMAVVLGKWKEDEEKDIDIPESSEKRGRSPPPKAPWAQKKLRCNPPPSQQPRRSVTQVITTFPSKTVVKVPTEGEAGIIHNIAHQNWRTAANLLSSHKELFDELKARILVAINEQCQNLTNSNNGFMLWKTSPKDVKSFSFHNLVSDLEHMSPFLLSLFNTISNNNQDAACAALCIALRGRDSRMSAFAYYINSIIARGGLKKAVFNRLSKMAITTSYSHALVKQKETAGAKGAVSDETLTEGELSSELFMNSEAEMDILGETEELQTENIDLEKLSAPT